MWWTLYLLIFIFLRMIIFKVKESILKVGPRKGQKAYSAVPKAPNRFSSTWLVERIVRETSLSEGDVRNVLITLRNIVKEIVSLGGALDLGDIFSLRTVITSKMEANEKDVSVTSLKRPHIVVTWKESVRKSLGDIKVEVDNPARKKLKETEEKPAGGGGGQSHP